MSKNQYQGAKLVPLKPPLDGLLEPGSKRKETLAKLLTLPAGAIEPMLFDIDHLHGYGILHEQGELLRYATKLFPNRHEVWHGLGQFYRLAGEHEQAADAYRKALELKPDYSVSQLALAQHRMWQSAFRDGAEGYEARFRNVDSQFREFPAPRWKGENIKGKRVFIWAEQGLGDIVQYATFLPYLLAQEPTRIVLAVPSKMVTLIERSFPQTSVEPLQSAYDQETYKGLFDYALPMGDVLVHCCTHYTPSKQNAQPVLKVDPARLKMVTDSLGRLPPGRKIGISFGTPNLNSSITRNIPLEAWRSVLSVPNCHFFSLQHSIKPQEIEQFCRQTGLRILVDPRLDPLRDIENLAALVAGMDEVISAQNANVHLAGALNVPTTLLLSRSGDFRWPKIERNLWYPSVQIEHQETLMEWEPVMERVAAGLRKRAAK